MFPNVQLSGQTSWVCLQCSSPASIDSLPKLCALPFFSKPSLDQHPGDTEQGAWPVCPGAGQGEATQEGPCPDACAQVHRWRIQGHPGVGVGRMLGSPQSPGCSLYTLRNITKRAVGVGVLSGNRESAGIWLWFADHELRRRGVSLRSRREKGTPLPEPERNRAGAGEGWRANGGLESCGGGTEVCISSARCPQPRTRRSSALPPPFH